MRNGKRHSPSRIRPLCTPAPFLFYRRRGAKQYPFVPPKRSTFILRGGWLRAVHERLNGRRIPSRGGGRGAYRSSGRCTLTRSKSVPTGSPARTSAPTARPIPGRSSRPSGGGAARNVIAPNCYRRARWRRRCATRRSAARGWRCSSTTRGGHRHEPPGTGAASDSSREEELAVHFERGRCAARRYHPESTGDVPAARGRCLHLPGRCASAHQRSSGQPGHRTDPANVEVAVRRCTDALGPRGAPPRSAITLSVVPQPRLRMPAYHTTSPIPSSRTRYAPSTLESSPLPSQGTHQLPVTGPTPPASTHELICPATPTWSMCFSASAFIRPTAPSNSPRECGSRGSPMPPFAQTSGRTTTIRHHTERSPATTAQNARLPTFAGPAHESRKPLTRDSR